MRQWASLNYTVVVSHSGTAEKLWKMLVSHASIVVVAPQHTKLSTLLGNSSKKFNRGLEVQKRQTFYRCTEFDHEETGD